MGFLKRNLAKILISAVIITFLVALFFAIFYRIEGFGIFAIVVGSMFNSYILYKLLINPANHAASTGSVSSITSILNLITSPIFIRVLPSLLTIVFSYLERHKDKLDKDQTKNLEKEIQTILLKFKSKIDQPINSADNNKNNS